MKEHPIMKVTIALGMGALFLATSSGMIPQRAEAQASAAMTTTTLAITSAGGGAVTTVESGSAVTLTAAVEAGAAAVTTGQVKFCDAFAPYCTDVHLLGTEQLTKAGTATIKFIPEIGNHSYKAVFSGTTSHVTSASIDAALTVLGAIPTTTSITASGSAGNYSLAAVVTGSGGAISPTGSVSFLDTSGGNAVLGSAALAKGAAGLSWSNSFSQMVNVAPYSIAAGDFNGDGIQDLAVANVLTNLVTILLGKGNGTFTQTASIPVAASFTPSNILVGDFNDDGNPDLAVSSVGTTSSENCCYRITILLGDGNGGFTRVADSPMMAASVPMGVAALGDFNGDGEVDLAVRRSDGNVLSDSTLTILLGNGNGKSFTQANYSLPIPFGAGLSAVGDFNGDGVPDLAVTDYENPNTVTILLGNRNGTFTLSW